MIHRRTGLGRPPAGFSRPQDLAFAQQIALGISRGLAQLDAVVFTVRVQGHMPRQRRSAGLELGTQCLRPNHQARPCPRAVGKTGDNRGQRLGGYRHYLTRKDVGFPLHPDEQRLAFKGRRERRRLTLGHACASQPQRGGHHRPGRSHLCPRVAHAPKLFAMSASHKR